MYLCLPLWRTCLTCLTKNRGSRWFFKLDFSLSFLAGGSGSFQDKKFGGSFIKMGPFWQMVAVFVLTFQHGLNNRITYREMAPIIGENSWSTPKIWKIGVIGLLGHNHDSLRWALSFFSCIFGSFWWHLPGQCITPSTPSTVFYVVNETLTEMVSGSK